MKSSLRQVTRISCNKVGENGGLLSIDLRDCGHLGEGFADAAVDDEAESDKEGDGGDDQDSEDKILHILGHVGVLALLSADPVARPHHHQIRRQQVPGSGRIFIIKQL